MLVAKALSEDRARWLACHALPHEAALRRWLSSRRLRAWRSSSSLLELEIDDIVQDTYERLIRAENLDAVHNPKAYVFQTAWSVLATYVRRERIIAMQTLADVGQLAIEADEPSPEQQVADRDELLHLAEAIAALPGNIGKVLSLRRVDGLSQKQVACRLGLAESTVEKHMRRGFLLLLERFARGGYVMPEAARMTNPPAQWSHGKRNGKVG